MTISSIPSLAQDILPPETWTAVIEETFIKRPSWENEVILGRLARVCWLFRTIIYSPSPYKRLVASERCIYQVSNADAITPMTRGIYLMHRHITFIYSHEAMFWNAKNECKVVDIKSGDVQYLPADSLTDYQFGVRIDNECAYSIGENQLRATNLSTYSETILHPSNQLTYRQSSNGKLIQANLKDLSIRFKVFKDGKEIAQIPHGANEKLFDFQIQNDCLCALYQHGTAQLFRLYDMTNRKFYCRIFRTFSKPAEDSCFNSAKSITIQFDRSTFSTPIFYLSNYCLVVVDQNIHSQDHSLLITAHCFEKKENEFVFSESTLSFPAQPGNYSFSLFDHRIAIAEHQSKKVSVWEVKKNPDSDELGITLINELSGVNLSDQSKVVLQGNVLAISSETKMQFYSINDSRPLSRPMTSFQTDSKIEDFQLDLDKDFPQLKLRLENNEVHVWAPDGTLPESALMHGLKVTYQWISFIIPAVIISIIFFIPGSIYGLIKWACSSNSENTS